jgi:uncharacterized protein
MSRPVLESFIHQYVAAQRAPEVVFSWQGGEPTLMGIDFYRLALEIQRRNLRPGMRLINSIQTNGLLLDDDWCAFLAENGFLVGLSLDGPRAMHDAYRVDAAGGPTWERSMHALRLLRKHGAEFNVLTAVHAANVQYPLEVYRFLRDEAGARFLQFLPVIEKDPGRGVSGRSVKPDAYGLFLSAAFDEWVRRDVGSVFVQVFDVALAAWSGVRPGLCLFEPTCGAALALEHNGDLYACDHFVDREHLLGNIMETPMMTLVTDDRQRRFGEARNDALPSVCRPCGFRFVCNGGCPKDRIQPSSNGEPPRYYLCEGMRLFFAHIEGPMRFMAAELRAGRPPANVMRLSPRLDISPLDAERSGG